MLYIFIILFILIFSRIINRKIKIMRKVDRINHIFYKSYKKSMNCYKEKCFYNCLNKEKNVSIFKEYTDRDIPGKYPYNYPILNNNQLICNDKLFLFISVISLCSDLEDRMAVRKAYKNIDKSIRLHFFIGYTTYECQNQFYEEKEIFNDISQMPIQESYSNQTIFTLYLHKILPIICPIAEYYGKMDADQFINFTKLINLLKINNQYNYIFYSCFTWKFYYVNTSKKYKYSSHKSIESYYKRVFPSNGVNGFTGSFGVWKSYLSLLIYKESLHEKHIIRMEDQHISWLIYKLKVKKIINISFYNLKCIDANYKCQKIYENIYGVHRIKGRALYSFHKLTM